MSAVVWHDVECGAYETDLPLWRELAAEHGGPVLDVGSGTGRVALDLAGRGVDVVAVDLEDDLLDALRARAGAAELDIPTHRADARSLDLGDARFPLIIVPMQTIQLLGGPAGRVGFLRSARAHLEPGGVLAIALADALEAFDEDHMAPPVPDMREVDGVVYASRPLAVQDLGEDGVVLQRLRETVTPDGHHEFEEDRIRLDRLDAPTLEDEGRTAGLTVLTRREVPATDEYVGSAVVMLGA